MEQSTGYFLKVIISGFNFPLTARRISAWFVSAGAACTHKKRLKMRNFGQKLKLKMKTNLNLEKYLPSFPMSLPLSLLAGLIGNLAGF